MSDRDWQARRPDLYGCPNDNDGDGNCGLPTCPACHPEKQPQDHTEIIDPRQHPLAAYPIARWVEASQWHPVPDRPILIWRASFTPDDFPVYGRYCSCHHRYIYSYDGWQTVEYADDATYWKDAYSGPQA